MADQGLKDKTVKGVGWSAIDNVAQYAVSLIVGIVLARLLSPDDYKCAFFENGYYEKYLEVLSGWNNRNPM